MNYRDFIKSYVNFPKDGVLFWDFSYLLLDVVARDAAINEMKIFLDSKQIDKIVAIESKGFTFGAILAHEIKKPMALIRKPGLIPGEFYSEAFTKEYGKGEYQLKKEAVSPGERIAVVYDIMAGSGASRAAVRLIEQCGGTVESLVYVTELEYLDGRKDLLDYDIFSLVKVQNKR